MPTTALAKHIADQVRSALAEHGITQQELADRLGVRQYWVSRRLTYKAGISAEDITRISGALGVPVSRFLPDEVAA